MNEKLTFLDVDGWVGGVGLKRIKIEVSFGLVLFQVFYIHLNIFFHFVRQ